MSTYTHGHSESVLRSHRWRTAENSAGYLLPHVRPEHRVLDVGTGPGTIAVDLARRVAQVTATEIGETELDLSRATAATTGVNNLDFHMADAHALPFADDSFDIAHAHQVLQHVSDPVRALRELARVTVPGGVIAARDCDYAASTWWPRVPEIDEWLRLYRSAVRARIAPSWRRDARAAVKHSGGDVDGVQRGECRLSRHVA
ncbi:class I SAM-dependent methyltransferase [Microbacterium amylolyticum]|uniref:Ubiquinone/menaquinone biosynthesis C-methylase UbiE n=1 Tax=Microbacterium amylolyticum TaxID=936337 RepID=A0ABS4ZG00_9MICO|nr:class I SAM-dependent methyltransferase [Microbacterium amylolyticum]MBP2436205.1 ubiquinone/menaquinone biosynthesis C-methylase UbiE [Microbacterium amylolyticum]